MLNNFGLSIHEKCTGCMLCFEVCENHAIEIVENEEDGFLYTRLNENLCNGCKSCMKICPQVNDTEFKNSYHQICYGVNSNDDAERFLCTSGGMFCILAKEVLSYGGVISGAVWRDDLTVFHDVTDDMNELPKFLKSKYIQSNMSEVYGKLIDYLKKNKKILFCGLPCQVDAIKRFAKKYGSEDRLITVDLFCRGVPSYKAFRLYLNCIETEHGKKIKSVIFKDKSFGWHYMVTRYVFEDGSEYTENWKQNEFEQSYIFENLSVRKSCYQCKYKNRERCADITIGDLWGFKDNRLCDDKGTSAVIINSNKGKEYFDKLVSEGKIDYECVSFEGIKKGNPAVFEQIEVNIVQREIFWRLLNEEDFRKAYHLVTGRKYEI